MLLDSHKMFDNYYQFGNFVRSIFDLDMKSYLFLYCHFLLDFEFDHLDRCLINYFNQYFNLNMNLNSHITIFCLNHFRFYLNPIFIDN